MGIEQEATLPHLVLAHFTPSNHAFEARDMIQWLEDNIADDDWDIDLGPDSPHVGIQNCVAIRFANSQQAMLFKLTWGGGHA